jgi:hypothetical protein
VPAGPTCQDRCRDGGFDDPLVGSYAVPEVTPSGYQSEADETVAVDNKAFCPDVPQSGRP